MVSIETVQAPATSPRISFSSELIDDDDDDEDNFISINPNHIDQDHERDDDNNKGKGITFSTRKTAAEFEFLSSHNSMEKNQTMLTADELFFDGKLLPFWQMHCSQKLNKITLNSNTQQDQEQQETEEMEVVIDKDDDNNKKKNREQETEQEQPRISSSSSNNGESWLIDEDPSPRPPKCTVLWKELLKLKKQRANRNNNNNKASTLSPSSSTSSSSSSSSSSVGDNIESGRENNVKRVKKGLERTRSTSIRIRPMVTVPLCTTTTSHHVRTNSNNNLPPLFNKKSRLLER